MKTRIISSIFSCLLILGMMIPEAAMAGDNGKGLNYKATFNGTVIEIAFDTDSDGFNANVARGSGKGTFGQSDGVVLTEFIPLGVTGDCESADDVYFTVLYSKSIVTYSQGEQLVMSSDGYPIDNNYLCLDFTTGDYEGRVAGVFDGGTGRFEHAYGTWENRFGGRNVTIPDGIPIGYAPINGYTTGTLYLK